MQKDLEDLRIAWLDLWYAIARETRLLRLAARLGMKERSWVEQARWRAEQSQDTNPK